MTWGVRAEETAEVLESGLYGNPLVKVVQGLGFDVYSVRKVCVCVCVLQSGPLCF